MTECAARRSTSRRAPWREGELFRARIMADGKYVKVYINGTRVANIPNAELGRSKKISIENPRPRRDAGLHRQHQRDGGWA